MRKLTATAAAAMIAVTLVSCGKGAEKPFELPDTTAASTEPATTAKTTSAEPTKPTTTTIKTTRKPKTTKTKAAVKMVENVSTTPVSDAEKADIEAVIKKLCRSMAEKDVDAMTECLFPNELRDSLALTNPMSEIVIWAAQNDDHSGLAVDSLEPLTDREMTILSKGLSAYVMAIRSLKAMNVDFERFYDGSYSEEEFDTLENAFKGFENTDTIIKADIEPLVDITNAKYATVTDRSSGNTMKVPVYKVRDEGWKVDTLILAFSALSDGYEQANADSKAEILKYATNNVLKQLGSAGYDIGGTYIISPNSRYEKYGSGYSLSDGRERLIEALAQQTDGEEYFLLIHDCDCAFAVMRSGRCIGTSQYGKIPVKLGGVPIENYETADIENYTYDQLFDLCAELVH